jgi:hypothetical protein
MSDFMESGKPSSLVTTFLNHTSLLRGGLVEGEWGSPKWQSSWMIAVSQDFIPGAGAQFWLSNDFAESCHMWDPRGHTYDVLVRFFPCRLYTDSNYHDTLRYEWLLARCCHLVVCLDVFMVGLEDSYVYHSYYCYTCVIMLITLLMLALSKL